LVLAAGVRFAGTFAFGTFAFGTFAFGTFAFGTFAFGALRRGRPPSLMCAVECTDDDMALMPNGSGAKFEAKLNVKKVKNGQRLNCLRLAYSFTHDFRSLLAPYLRRRE
jgi:hypothetical protein